MHACCSSLNTLPRARFLISNDYLQTVNTSACPSLPCWRRLLSLRPNSWSEVIQRYTAECPSMLFTSTTASATPRRSGRATPCLNSPTSDGTPDSVQSCSCRHSSRQTLKQFRFLHPTVLSFSSDTHQPSQLLPRRPQTPSTRSASFASQQSMPQTTYRHGHGVLLPLFQRTVRQCLCLVQRTTMQS